MIQILQGCWRPLKLKSKKEHDLQRHEVRETSRGKALSDVEVIRRKEAKITKKEDNQEYSNSVYFTILSHKTLSWYQPISQGMTENMLFSFRYSPWNLVNDCACSKYRNTNELPESSCCAKSVMILNQLQFAASKLTADLSLYNVERPLSKKRKRILHRILLKGKICP